MFSSTINVPPLGYDVISAFGPNSHNCNPKRLIEEFAILKAQQRPLSYPSEGNVDYAYYLNRKTPIAEKSSRIVHFLFFAGLGIPILIFFLKFFEEMELELRFGESYKEYKQKVPFLIPKLSVD